LTMLPQYTIWLLLLMI